MNHNEQPVIPYSDLVTENIQLSIKEQMEALIKKRAVTFANWCKKHAWEEDYRQSRTHTTEELYEIFIQLYNP